MDLDYSVDIFLDSENRRDSVDVWQGEVIFHLFKFSTCWNPVGVLEDLVAEKKCIQTL